MTDYRYLYYSLITERIITEIPLQGTYFEKTLNVGGRGDGTFSLDMTGYDNQTLMDATIPGRCGLIVERDGIPIWDGFVWSRVYQSQAKTVQLFHQSWEDYPSTQLVLDDKTYSGEQIEMFKQMWRDMQAVTGRGVNINVSSTVFPTVTVKSVDVLATDLKFYNEIMSSIADADDGFDWTIDISKSGNTYVRTLRTGFPRMGSTDRTRLTFEYPGGALNYYATESMVDSATNVVMTGAGSGSNVPSATASSDDLIASGFPRWDVVVARKDVTDQSLLNTLAIQEAQVRRPPMLTFKPTFKSNQSPKFGEWGIGDSCVLYVKDARFPNGITFNARIACWQLQPQSADNVDYYNLIFVGDTQ